jgi:hypothetical protein
MTENETKHPGGAPLQNKNRETFGHRSAEHAIQQELPFAPGSLATIREQEIFAALQKAGVGQFTEQNAVRVQTVLELFWSAILAAAQANQWNQVERLAVRFVGFASKAARLWDSVAAVRALTVEGDYEVLLETLNND